MTEDQLPSIPANYCTSDTVRTGISLAYSTTFNPRNLEHPWYAPYAQTFAELVLPYQGHLVMTPQYSLSLPSAVVAAKKGEKELRQSYAIEQVPYDLDENAASGSENDKDEDSDHDDSGGRASDVDYQPPSSILRGHQADRPHSERLKGIEQKKKESKQKRIEGLTQKTNLYLDTELAAIDVVSAGPGPTSLETMASLPDANAQDSYPDFAISHVAKHKLPLNNDDPDKTRRHNTRRAGVKISHHCCLLFAELKSSVKRKGDPEFLDMSWAQEELIGYCATYFEREIAAKSIVVIAALGPFWTWTTIFRADVANFDCITFKFLKEHDERVMQFSAKFNKQDICTLGTEDSDKQLSQISLQYLYPSLKDDHAPKKPQTIEPKASTSKNTAGIDTSNFM